MELQIPVKIVKEHILMNDFRDLAVHLPVCLLHISEILFKVFHVRHVFCLFHVMFVLRPDSRFLS